MCITLGRMFTHRNTLDQLIPLVLLVTHVVLGPFACNQSKFVQIIMRKHSCMKPHFAQHDHKCFSEI